MKNRTVDKDRGLKKLQKELRLLGQKPHVKAGLFGSANHKKSGQATVVDIGIVNEFGSPKRNIPERSFMRSTFDERKAFWFSRTRRVANLILTGRMTVSRGLDILGLAIERDHKSKIRRGDPSWPELSEKTVQRKKGSPKKLIDSAQMVNSIKHKKVMNS